jgi:hypothetical protein
MEIPIIVKKYGSSMVALITKDNKKILGITDDTKMVNVSIVLKGEKVVIPVLLKRYGSSLLITINKEVKRFANIRNVGDLLYVSKIGDKNANPDQEELLSY